MNQDDVQAKQESVQGLHGLGFGETEHAVGE
jgi:hypothetical protein